MRSKIALKTLPKLQKLHEDCVEVKPIDLDPVAIRSRIYHEWSSIGHLRNMLIGDLRRGAWVLFITIDIYEPLANSMSFSNAYFEAVQLKGKASIVGALLYAFIRDYPNDLSTFDYWRRNILLLIETTKSRRLIQWRNRITQYNLFSDNGPSEVAKYIIRGDEQLNRCIENVGLNGELSVSRFFELSCKYGWDWIRNMLSSGNATERDLLKIIQLSMRDDKLRFPHLKNELAISLLLPFTSKKPKPDFEKNITEFLVNKIGDPRINPVMWNGIDRKATNVIRQWLVGLTLIDFFRLIDKTAYEEHWMYRNQFWWSYYRNGLISDAWVALGRQTALQAERVGINDFAEYGRIRSGGLPDHSVLIMKIGTAVIVERSHIGKCRIWLSGNRHKPELWQKDYNNYSLMRGANEEFVHHGSENGRWQMEISDYLRRNLGIRPPEIGIIPT